MQQTEAYKLNLIESSDTFSPDPINENMEKLEAVITAETAALDQRLQVFEAKHFEIGTYIGTGQTPDYVMLGYTPKMVIVFSGVDHYTVILDFAVGINGLIYLKLADGGFQTGSKLNVKDVSYPYVAIG